MTAELVEFVLEQTTRPLDRWAVAATLESGGIRDVDARERFGRRDVFDLADEVYALCLEAGAAPVEPEPEPVPRRRRALEVAGQYVHGGFFFVPLALQLGSLVLLGYGQWASLDFSPRQASIVGTALLASFLVTGGFAQALGYLGPYFAEPGKHLLAARVVGVVVGLALATLAAGALLIFAVNLFTGSYDGRSIGAGLVYYALAGGVSVASAVLYMLKRYLAMLVATVGGIAVVGLVLHGFGLGIYAAHWIGLGATILVEAAWAVAVLARRSVRTADELRGARLPPVPVIVTIVAPYAVYGAAYFGLLFVDRLAAWSAGARGLPLTFRAPYEVGLDWALISVVPALALLEVTINSFSARLAELGSRHRAGSAADHNRELLRFYRRQLALVAVLLAAGAAAAFGGLRLAADVHALRSVSGLFSDRTTLHVYPLALAGYALLVWALFNGLFLFSLGRAWLVIRALVPAIAVAAPVAFVLSRAVVYWAAAGGLVAGALVFAVLSARSALRVLRSVDYHYFAAY